MNVMFDSSIQAEILSCVSDTVIREIYMCVCV